MNDTYYPVKRDIHLMLDQLVRSLPSDLAVPTAVSVSRNTRGDLYVKVTSRYFLPTDSRPIE